MNRRHCYYLGLAILGGSMSVPALAADSLAEALSSGKAYGNFRLRYESVEQNNALADADALTLRTRLGYKTGSIGGFSALIEVEDSRIVGGGGDFTVPPTGFNANPNQFSVIADPETTEIDQAFIQYKNDVLTTKLGAQVITLDNHRFIGHVGWRQDRQTFDALTFKITPSEKVAITAAHIYKRNRIFAEDADLDSKDNIFNISYKTPVGKLSGYAYLLEDASGGNDGATRDTVGARFAGAKKSGSNKFLYELEFADQEFESGDGVDKYEADYTSASFGIVTSGITFKLGYEVLGAAEVETGSASNGFATPLATLHKFNGWADAFLATPTSGLEDLYFLISSKVGPGKLTVKYHDFTADEITGEDDLGSEIDLAYGMKFGKSYFGGIKYADYSVDDRAVGGADTEKLALWVGAKF